MKPATAAYNAAILAIAPTLGESLARERIAQVFTPIVVFHADALIESRVPTIAGLVYSSIKDLSRPHVARGREFSDKEIAELSKAAAGAISAHIALRCPKCRGSGVMTWMGVYRPPRGDDAPRSARSSDCDDCKGRGYVGDGVRLEDPEVFERLADDDN